MKRSALYFIAGACLLNTLPATAELPEITRKPWAGYFIGIEERKFQFGYLPNGEGELDPVDSRGEKISANNSIEIEFKVLETAPDGKVVSKQIKPGSLTSSSPADKNPTKPITISGKVTGDATFQIIITPGSKTFSLSGAITDQGSLKNPLTFLISANFNPYVYQSASDKDELEKFEKKIKREEMLIELSSGKSEKIEFTENANLSEKFPEPIKNLELKTAAYGGTEFEFSATGDSKIIFEDRGKDYLWNSFTLHWIPDPSASPDSQSLTIGGN
ncbi:hypothetical protein [Luteolibacter sp. AS25]|uniref:hypothetical protein n=1 Tax=Luteolibacter sp. AS25 TaxID=3135776 RepID=UPI00398B29F7